MLLFAVVNKLINEIEGQLCETKFIYLYKYRSYMATNLFVGGLPYATTDDDLLQAFQQAGDVKSAKVITDRDTGRSKGFGFVEMTDDDGAKKAIESLNGSDLGGRSISVSEARPKPEYNNKKQFNDNSDFRRR